MTTSTVLFESRDKILSMTSGAKIMTLKTLSESTFVLGRRRVTIFVYINKIVSMLIRTIIKDSNKKK